MKNGSRKFPWLPIWELAQRYSMPRAVKELALSINKLRRFAEIRKLKA
jgi:hypothetical protein